MILFVIEWNITSIIFLSPCNVIIGNLLMFVPYRNLTCVRFSFPRNVVENMLGFVLEVNVAHDRFL